ARGPQIVGRVGHGRHAAGMLPRPPATPLLHQSPPREQIAGGADGWPLDRGVSRLQPREEFARPPAGMLPPRGADHRRDIPRDAMRAVMRNPAAITQTEPTALLKAREPFVTGLAADAVAGAQLGHGVQTQAASPNEALTLFHG